MGWNLTDDRQLDKYGELKRPCELCKIIQGLDAGRRCRLQYVTDGQLNLIEPWLPGLPGGDFKNVLYELRERVWLVRYACS